ncbi:MAG: bifunctional oligoribonuclease/PAP phosphatase NrnA, partial [Clostridia bacterium]|nr:bifunctional oligoribonuclease/PAP phosphatase NrnA [Clostridia bacterium]
PGAERIVDPGEALPFAPATAVAVDVSDRERLGEAGMRAFDRCPEQAVIDHHATNPGFGQVMLLDGDAAAVGELLTDVIRAMGVELSADVAECLFVAISTDTGNFNFSCTRPQTFEAAAKCAAAGIQVDAITTRLYRTRTYGRTKLLGLVLAGLEVSKDGRLAWARLTEEMLSTANATPEDNEGIVNYLLEIEGVQCAVLANERGEQTKLSLRSKEPLDVAEAVAVPLGGGGHACAAGVTLDLPVDAALQKALELAARAIGGDT